MKELIKQIVEKRPADDLEAATYYDSAMKRLYEAAERVPRGAIMKTIRFSHAYPKLHKQTTAQLLAVLPMRIDRNTPDELLEYDTTYYCGAEKIRFPLPTGNYIQLVFLGNLRIPFCTIRPAFPPSKVEYYTGSIGEKFNVEVCDVR